MGVREIVRLNPRSPVPGLVLLACIVAAVALVGAWVLVADLIALRYGIQRIGVLYFTGGIAVTLVLQYLMSQMPLRMVICKGCNRAKRIGIGKGVPLEWQRYIEPQLKCTQCGYSLVGITRDPRCPECGFPFPREWLKVTGQGRADVRIVYRVVDRQETGGPPCQARVE